MSEPLDERQLADLADGAAAEELRLAAHALRSGAAVLGACLLADRRRAARPPNIKGQALYLRAKGVG